MRVEIYLDDNEKRILLKPENEFDKKALDMMSENKEADIKRFNNRDNGGLYGIHQESFEKISHLELNLKDSRYEVSKKSINNEIIENLLHLITERLHNIEKVNGEINQLDLGRHEELEFIEKKLECLIIK